MGRGNCARSMVRVSAPTLSAPASATCKASAETEPGRKLPPIPRIIAIDTPDNRVILFASQMWSLYDLSRTNPTIVIEHLERFMPILRTLPLHRVGFYAIGHTETFSQQETKKG